MNKVLFSSAKDDWETPQWLFDSLNDHYHFTLDPCASDSNHKCRKYMDKTIDGLSMSWSNEVVFCNPPYGRVLKNWVYKGYIESKKPNTTVVMLLPARTDTSWFHDYILNHAKIWFIRGRLKFGGSKNSAPFPSMVVQFLK